MKPLYYLLGFLFLAQSAYALHRGYYNHPDIHGDTIVFASEGDLWKVSADGGVASRLTSDDGMELYPRISPDGNTIAFAAQYDGNYDVYTMPMEGGAPNRLTWHPYSDVPSGWTADGSAILHFTARSHPHRDRETYIIPAIGGVPQEFPIGSSTMAVMAPDGKTVAFNRNYVQPRSWKRYGGGLADDIWIGNLETGEFEQITEYFGNDYTPMFVGERLYFASERDGRINLWSVERDGDDLEQHTTFTEFDVRYPQTDGESRIVFQNGADIYLYDTATEETQLIDIQLPSDRPQTRRHFPTPHDFLEEYAVSNDGKKTLLSMRGDLFNVPSKHGVPIPLTQSQGVRETRAVFAGEEEEYALYVSDKSGNYELYRADARTGEEATLVESEEDEERGNIQPFFNLAVSPNGERVAYADQTGTLYWTGITTPTLARIDRSDVWEIRDYDWSPDDRYLAYAKFEENGYRRLYVYDSVTSETQPVTSGFYDAYSPAWDPKGDYLFFISARSFNRQEASFEYETVMVDPMKIYAILLNEGSENPFYKKDPYEEDDEKKQEEAEKEKEEKEDKPDIGADDEATTGTLASADDEEEEEEEKIEVDIVFDNILERQIAFPVDSGDLYGLTAVDGKIFYLRSADGDTNLVSFSYGDDEPEEKVFASDVRSYTLSRNRQWIAYRTGNKVSVAETSAGESGKDDATPAIDSAHLVIDPVAEWKQILQEAFRYNRDFFYSPTMGETDWAAVRDDYLPLVDRVSIRAELTDIIGNFIGELGHGHTYVWGEGDAPTGRSIATGVLGVDFSVDKENDLVVLDRIYRGERWDGSLRSPFNTRKTAEVEEGSYLLKVNGRPVTPDVDPLSHFWGYGDGAEVLLTLATDPSGEDAKEYRIFLLGDEYNLRHHAWVEGKRVYTAAQSDGKIGYIYLPNMSDEGLQSFFREFFPQLDKDAMVIDVRWNGGGNVSQKIIRRLNQELYAYMISRNFSQPSTYPERVFTGPMATLINDRCGSDGDIFSRSFRRFELGPLIGERTWGGTVGIRFQTRLVDGAQITVPEFAFIDPDRGYDIENYGISPDKGFEVPLTPEDEVAGNDPQLDRAIEYLTKEMTKDDYDRFEIPEDYPDRSTESFRDRSRKWMNRP